MSAAMRQRGPNFSEAEKDTLLDIIFEFQHIIESKLTDAVSVSAKNQAWDQVANKFNAASTVYNRRDTKQLKKCYENIKKRFRRHERLRSGSDGPGDIVGPTLEPLAINFRSSSVCVKVEEPYESSSSEDSGQLLNQQSPTGAAKLTGLLPIEEVNPPWRFCQQQLEEEAVGSVAAPEAPSPGGGSSRLQPEVDQMADVSGSGDTAEAQSVVAASKVRLLELQARLLQEKHRAEMDILAVRREQELLKLEILKMELKKMTH